MDPMIHDDLYDMYGNMESEFDLMADPILAQELEMFVSDIDIGKSSCIQGVSTLICKNIMSNFPKEIAYIFRCSIETAIFPDEWSKGYVTVIPKNGKLSDPSNWRPITQTSIFAKIFEKLVHRRVMFYFMENDILSHFQYGFCRGKSTQQSVFDFVKYVYSSLNNKKLFTAICLDVCKAFDCINHDILLLKLSKIGFSENTITWFKSYLNRTQVVTFKNCSSDELKIKTGIGQGTILGPLIFIFYINDIVQTKGNLRINMYADDCLLFKTGNNWNIMKEHVQSDLNNVQSWCVRNRLKLNVAKSKTLLIGSDNKLKTVDINAYLNLDGTPLNFVDKYKYLGITLDKHMTLTALLSTVKKNVSSHLFKLRKLRSFISTKCAILIYKQTIMPLLDYPGFLLNSCNISDRKDLQVLQNDALRTCYNVRRRDRLSLCKLHAEAKLLSLEQRRNIQLLSLMYLHKKNHDVQRAVRRATRGARRYKFSVERYNTVKYKNSPFYKGCELWDTLPKPIIDSETLVEFKKLLRREFVSYVEM